MRKSPVSLLSGGVWSLVLGVLLGAASAPRPAGAGEVFAWRTEDGGYAYTDDEKAIPPRYRDEARVRDTGSLAGYRRFTPEDDGATRSYEQRLRERVEHLQRLNAALERSPRAAAGARGGETSELVILRGGRRDRGGVDIGVPVRGGEGPLVVETVHVRRGSITEPIEVTRRGGEILSVSKPRARQWDLGDVFDEEDLEPGR